MSRSYKKVCGCVDRNPYMKKLANRRVRHSIDVPDGKAYRKYTDSWDICDYKFGMIYTKKDLISDIKTGKITKEDAARCRRK